MRKELKDYVERYVKYKKGSNKTNVAKWFKIVIGIIVSNIKAINERLADIEQEFEEREDQYVGDMFELDDAMLTTNANRKEYAKKFATRMLNFNVDYGNPENERLVSDGKALINYSTLEDEKEDLLIELETSKRVLNDIKTKQPPYMEDDDNK